MKDKFDTINSNTFIHSDWDKVNSLSEASISEMEKEICHLRTLSVYDDRKIARKLYAKIKARISSIHDTKEKIRLNQLALLISMKIKRV